MKISALMIAICVALALPVLAQESAPAIPTTTPPLAGTLAEDVQVKLNLEQTNLFLLRNDMDFDNSDPFYDKYSQSEGFMGSFLKPMVTINKGDYLRFYYETEIGTDLWSYNTPDAGLGKTTRSLSMKQREIWAQADVGDFHTKAGFQRVTDTSGLFINHWIGAARFSYGPDVGSHLTLTVGQLPDQTFEGWDFGAVHLGSFADDIMLASLDGRWALDDNVKLDAGLYYVRDGSIIDHTRQVMAVSASCTASWPDLLLSASLVGQFGTNQNAGADGSDTGITAFALSATAVWSVDIFQIKANAIAMTADDEFEGNDSTGFLWSGKRPAQAALLNENQTRDIGDNIDEKLGIFDGWFYQMTPGLAGADLGFYALPLPWLKLGVVTSALMTLNPDNSMGSRFVGSENELIVDMTFLDGLFTGLITGGVLFPGEAGAAFSNILPNRTATDPMYFLNTAIIMRL